MIMTTNSGRIYIDVYILFNTSLVKEDILMHLPLSKERNLPIIL